MISNYKLIFIVKKYRRSHETKSGKNGGKSGKNPDLMH